MKRMGMVSLVALALAGCGGAGARVFVTSGDVDGAGGSPSVSRVTDLGSLQLQIRLGEKLTIADSDGVFTVGELVLIEGDDFGKLPAVNIGGRPAEPLARTGNGGIIARIPAGIPTGSTAVEISHRRGRGSRDIEVVRFGLLVQPVADTVHVLRFSGKEVAVHGTLSVPGARAVAISHDGAAAYVAADAAGDRRSAAVAVIAMAASGGPKLLRTLRLSGTTADVVVAAARAPVAAVIGDGRLTMVNTGASLSPSPYDAVPIRGIDGPTAAAIHPDGEMLGLLSATGNQLLPLDVGAPNAPRAMPAVSLLPDETVPLVADIGFSPSGDELWVVAGDNMVSLVGGKHPARLIDLDLGAGGLVIDRTVGIAGLDAPQAVAYARRESIGSATAIRSTANKAAIVCASLDRGLLMAGREAGSLEAALENPRPMGAIMRLDLEGRTELNWSEEATITALELSHDARTVVAAVSRVDRTSGPVTHRFAAAVMPFVGGKAKYLPLGKAATGATLLSRASVALAP